MFWIWIYLIALILYIIGFTLRSCLYETISYWRTIDLAKEDPRYRYKKKTPVWHILLFALVYCIPILNILGGCICMAWGLPDNDSEFHLWEENKLSKILGKIDSFLTKEVW